jgi:hypothetical protein
MLDNQRIVRLASWRSVIVVFIIMCSLAPVAAQFSAEMECEASPLHRRSILVDGILDDWTGIEPAIRRQSGDEMPPSARMIIDTVYLCEDDNFIYLRFDLVGGKPLTSYDYPYIFEVQIGLGADDVIILQYRWESGQGWTSNLARWIDGKLTILTVGSVRKTPFGLEGRVSLATFQKWVKPGISYSYMAKVSFEGETGVWMSRYLKQVKYMTSGAIQNAIPVALRASDPVVLNSEEDTWTAGVNIGETVDLIGILLAAGGGAFYAGGPAFGMETALTVGSLCLNAGAIAMSVGSFTMNKAIDRRHLAYKSKGMPVTERARSRSWTLTWMTTFATAAGAVFSLIIEDPIAAGITVLSCNVLSIGLESWNLRGPRMVWAESLDIAAMTAPFASELLTGEP